MTDLSRKDAANPVQIVGRDEQYIADVVNSAGNIKRLAVTDDGVTATPATPTISSKLRYVHSDTPVALTASFQTVFTYSGSGKLTAFSLLFDKAGVEVKLTIDSTEIIFQLTSAKLDALSSQTYKQGVGNGGVAWDNSKSVFIFEPVFPLVYDSEVKIEVLKTIGPAVDLDAQIVSLTKET